MKNISDYYSIGSYSSNLKWVDLTHGEFYRILTNAIENGVVYVQEGALRFYPCFHTTKAGFVSIADNMDIAFDESMSGHAHIVATKFADVMKDMKAYVVDGKVVQLRWICMSIPYCARFFTQTSTELIKD